MRLNRGGSTLGQARVEGPKIKYTCIEGLKRSPEVEGMGLLEKPPSLLRSDFSDDDSLYTLSNIPPAAGRATSIFDVL
jgi:hypothetical protein